MYLPRSIFAVNIYFPPYSVNPQEYHNKVMWYLLPKTVYDKMEECLMRENAGNDPDDPQPSGLFFDPEACLVFQLEVTHKGGFNNYETSKFLLKPQSIGETKEDIKVIMDQRFDLWDKSPTRNKDELGKLLEKLYGGTGSPKSAPKANPKKSPQESAGRAQDDPEDEEVLPTSTKKAAPPSDDEVMPPSKKGAPAEEEPNLKEDIEDPELQKLIDEVQGDV